MKKITVWMSVIVLIAITIIFVSTNIKFEKIALETSGKAVDGLIIENDRTIPSIVADDNVSIEINISVREVFSKLEIVGDIILDGTVYKIISSYGSGRGYRAALSPANALTLAGDIMLSKDLQYFSIHINDSDLIVAPAASKEAAEEAVHSLYGAIK